MSHYTGQSSINNRKTTNIQEILETLFVRLAADPIIQDPPVYDRLGNQIRITKIRDYDGIELQNLDQTSLTMSIYPYTYSGPGQVLTTASRNASIVFDPYTIGKESTPLGPLDKATASIMIKLHIFGYDYQQNTEPYTIQNQQTVFDFNQSERALRQWGELIRMILVSRLLKLPSVTLPSRHLLSNSYVNHIDFSTGQWEKDANIVFHTCSILWQVVYYVKRTMDPLEEIAGVGGGPIGTIPNPGDGNTIPVCYDFSGDRYYNCASGTSLDPNLLVDPTTGTFYSSLSTNALKLVDLINSARSDFVTVIQDT